MLKLVTGMTSKILLARAQRVPNPLAPDIQALLPQMREMMREENGIGLAAPQIGLSLRLAVAEADGHAYCFINPEITSRSQATIVFEEGCLSLPGEIFPIVRAEEITLRYQNEKGLPKKIRARGLLAIVIQHEIDHLEGVLIAHRYAKDKRSFSTVSSAKKDKPYGRLAS